MKTATIFALVCWLVPPAWQTHNNETEESARTRYMTISRAIYDVTEKDDRLALFLLTVARHESDFKRKIHNGTHKGDHGKSWGLFQMRVGKDPESKVPGTPYRAKDIVGTDLQSTKNAVSAAAHWLSRHIDNCGGRPLCVFRCYGGVGKNPDKETKARLVARVKTYRMLVIKRAANKKKPD